MPTVKFFNKTAGGVVVWVTTGGGKVIGGVLVLTGAGAATGARFDPHCVIVATRAAFSGGITPIVTSRLINWQMDMVGIVTVAGAVVLTTSELSIWFT